MEDNFQCPLCREEFKRLCPKETVLPDAPLHWDEELGVYTCLAGHRVTREGLDTGFETLSKPKNQKDEKTARFHRKSTQEKLPETTAPANLTGSQNANDLERLDNGDAKVTLLVRESLVEPIRELAMGEKQTPQQWLQARLDWWLENEFL